MKLFHTITDEDLYMLHSNREVGKIVSLAAQNRLCSCRVCNSLFRQKVVKCVFE